jgi:CBS domain-containing protein
MQVSEVMTRAAVTESPADSLRDAASRMWKQQTGSLLVMEGDELLGIVTERDLMKAVARGADLDNTPVSAVMTRTVLTVAPDTSLHQAARHMATRWIRHLPIVADGQVVGMVSQRDLCWVLAALGAAERRRGDARRRARPLASAGAHRARRPRLMTGPDDPLLPDRTTDETEVGWGDEAPDDEDDTRRFVDDRPPHHEDRD